jgi:hypothetical protein
MVEMTRKATPARNKMIINLGRLQMQLGIIESVVLSMAVLKLPTLEVFSALIVLF